jgi:lysozyme family protein
MTTTLKLLPPVQRMTDFIVNAEARRDSKGRLKVYPLPKADGGGTYEVAGINDRYHPIAARHLADLIQYNRHDEAEAYIRDYLADYTAVARQWTTHPAIEAFLRDSVFNRGPKGALRILQIALKVPDDGKFGPITKAALKDALMDPRALLTALRKARESYERRIAPPVGARAKFWKGLQNRWNAAHAFALTFL